MPANCFVRLLINVYVGGRTQTRWVVAGSSGLPHVVEALRRYIPAHVPYEIQSYTRWIDFRKTLTGDWTWDKYVAAGKAKLVTEHPFDLGSASPTTPLKKQIDVMSLIRVGRNVPQSDVDKIVARHVKAMQKDLDAVDGWYGKIHDLTTDTPPTGVYVDIRAVQQAKDRR